jgi:catechol 2,3-dioxygenase-like lactoylglutathione lyase family enzyme
VNERGLVPLVGVTDVARSVEFYSELGFELTNRLEREGQLVWALLTTGEANLMLTLADAPIDPEAQHIVLYLYAPDVVALHGRLRERDVTGVGALAHPVYREAGEFRIADPDGHMLLVGQRG